MQLLLSLDELKVLAEVIERREDQFRQAAQNGHAAENGGKRAMLQDILEKLIRRDLHFDTDELDALSDLLQQRDRELHDEIQRATDAGHKSELERYRLRLEPVLDKVTEACAMA